MLEEAAHLCGLLRNDAVEEIGPFWRCPQETVRGDSSENVPSRQRIGAPCLARLAIRSGAGARYFFFMEPLLFFFELFFFFLLASRAIASPPIQWSLVSLSAHSRKRCVWRR